MPSFIGLFLQEQDFKGSSLPLRASATQRDRLPGVQWGGGGSLVPPPPLMVTFPRKVFTKQVEQQRELG